jgi:hypothetical protein
LDFGETSFGLEDFAPETVEFGALGFFLAWRIDIGVFVDGVKLFTIDGIEKNFCSLLYALEETIVLSITGSRFLIWMMFEDLLSVGALDLLFRSLVAIFRYTKNGIMILSLY